MSKTRSDELLLPPPPNILINSTAISSEYPFNKSDLPRKSRNKTLRYLVTTFTTSSLEVTAEMATGIGTSS
jgi:hypothetical protein